MCCYIWNKHTSNPKLIIWRKRSMPTQSRRFNPPTFEVKNGLETA